MRALARRCGYAAAVRWGAKHAILWLAIAGCGRIDYDVQGCSDPPPGDAIAAYGFDSSPVDALDSVGDHDGVIGGDPSGLTSVASPSGCGQAVGFDLDRTGVESWITIPDSPAWDLSRGSIDVWVRAPADGAGAFAGILTRDAEGTTQGGHVALFIEPDGTVWARLQRNAAQVAYRCADAPIAAGEWGRVTVNFGPPDLELLVDGSVQGRATPLASASGTDVRCGEQRMNDGIAGNDNPWILGGNGARAPEGAGEPVTDFFRGGAIDELRISASRLRP
jgi:hypothetical protein